jgi:23S rRNA (pseudouridine1915-N3)-methyltransferase
MPFPIQVIAVGRRNSVLDVEIDRFAKLMRPFVAPGIVFVKPAAESKNGIGQEGAALLSKLKAGTYAVALSEEGRRQSSTQFATWLSSVIRSQKSLSLIIGGAYGLPETLKKTCRETLSLSPLTLPHKLCLLVLMEQIYRACTILNHHPYHKE